MIMKLRLMFFAVMTLVFSSCEVEEEGLRVSYEILPIEEVVLPNTFNFGQEYAIPVKFVNPTTCHVFSGFDVDAHLNERTISLVAAKLDGGNCEDQSQLQVEQDLYFKAASNGSYILKFYKGMDSDGEPLYLEYEIQVIE